MRALRSTSVLATAILLLIAASAGQADSVATLQQPAGMLANLGDLETWSRYDERAGETEVGLGLQPSGSAGPVLLAFSAKFPGKIALRAPEAVIVQAGVSPRVNPNVLRTPTLVFILDAKMPRKAVMDLSARMSVDSPGPGAIVSTGRGSMSPEEYLRLLGATTVDAQVLGLDATLTRAQLRAMRDFAERIHIRPKS